MTCQLLPYGKGGGFNRSAHSAWPGKEAKGTLTSYGRWARLREKADREEAKVSKGTEEAGMREVEQ